MYVLNLRFNKIDLKTIEDIIQLEFCPLYSNTFDDLVIHYAERFSVMNENNYLVTIALKQRNNDVVVSIVSGGAAKSPFDLFTWGSERRSSKSIKSEIEVRLKDLGYNVEIDIIDDGSVS